MARSFIEPFMVAAAAIVGLYLVAEAFSDLNDYLHEVDSFLEALYRMARMHILRIPTFLAPVLPVAMLIGAAYGLAQLSGKNELTVMRVSGVSLWRIIAPVYAMAVIVALLGVANRELVVPNVERYVASDLNKWTGETENYERVMLSVPEEDTFFTMTYNVALRQARAMTINNKETGEHIEAREARPDSGQGGWMLHGVEIGSEKVPDRLWKTSLRRRDVELELQDPTICRIKMLRRLIRKERKSLEPNEARLRAYTLLYHARLAYPFTGLVLIGLGIPFVIAHERIQRSRMIGVGVCLLICMIFYAIQFIADDLGRTGHLPPQLAAWLPTIIFGALGLYMLETVHS